MLDPNQQKFSKFGQMIETTLMMGERLDISLSLVGRDEATGRTCYAVEQSRFNEPVYLVFPRRAGGTYRLIFGGSMGSSTNVVFLDEEQRDDIIAGPSAAQQ